MERDDELNFAGRMAELRTALGMSQSELARRMVERGYESYSQTSVSRTEKGDRPIRLGEARALAEILGSDIESMMRGTPVSEYIHSVGKTRKAIEKSMFDTVLALWDFDRLKEEVDALTLTLSLIDDDAPGFPEAHRDLGWLRQLILPTEAVAVWAAEIAGSGRDLTHADLLLSDIQRIRKLAGGDGLDQAEG